MKFFIYLLFFLSYSTIAMTIKKMPSGGKLVDLNGDGKIDFQIDQKQNIIDIYFKTSSGKKKNITSKRDDHTFIKEYKIFDGVNWKLQKRVRLEDYGTNQQKKTIQFILADGNVREKVYLFNKAQLFEGLRPIVPQVGDGVFTDGTLIQDQVFKATKDCLTLEIISRGMEVNVEGIMSLINSAGFSWEDYIDLQGCGDVCSPGQDSLTCPNNPVSIQCPIVMKNIILDGIKDKLVCLAENNRELAAEALGVLINDQKKMTIQCQSARELGGAYAAARHNCSSDYPKIRLSRIGCRPDSSGGDSALMLNIEALKGAFLHELIHTTGQSHGEHPDLAYACHAACMDVQNDSLSRFYGQDESPDSISLKQSAQTVCQNRLGEDQTETYIQHMRAITDNVGSITLFNGFLNRSFSSGRQFATDPLMLFESLWRDSNFYIEKMRKEGRTKWTPPEGEWQFCRDSSEDNDNCEDSDGEFRAKFFKKIISDKSFSPMMINMLMYSPNTKNLRSDFVQYLGYSSVPRYMKASDTKNLIYNGALKDVMVITDLKRIGEKLKRKDYIHALIELDSLKSRRASSMINNPTNSKHMLFYLNFVDGIKKQMKSLCVEQMQEIQKNPVSLDLCQRAL